MPWPSVINDAFLSQCWLVHQLTAASTPAAMNWPADEIAAATALRSAQVATGERTTALKLLPATSRANATACLSSITAFTHNHGGSVVFGAHFDDHDVVIGTSLENADLLLPGQTCYGLRRYSQRHTIRLTRTIAGWLLAATTYILRASAPSRRYGLTGRTFVRVTATDIKGRSMRPSSSFS
ncbi:hypothetical protein WI664_10340 [Vibrio cholerae]